MTDPIIAILAFVGCAALGALIAVLARRLTVGLRERNARVDRDIAALRRFAAQPKCPWSSTSIVGDDR